jgi:hypothetical protein
VLDRAKAAEARIDFVVTSVYTNKGDHYVII